MTDSWWLKLDRAEHHLKEVNAYIAAFSDPHPYEAVRKAKAKVNGQKVVRYALHFTGQPDERLAVVVGDVVHNVRSALDHVVTSMAPNSKLRREVGFFIFESAPYDDDGKPVDGEAGKSWAALQAALPAQALAQIDCVQPYQPAPADVVAYCAEHGLSPTDVHGIAILNKLDNADKHRRLVPISQGLENAVVTVTRDTGGEVKKAAGAIPGIVMDGAIVTTLAGPEANHPEVKVEIDGTPLVAVEVEQEKGAVRIPRALERMIADGRGLVDSLVRLGASEG